MNLFLKIALVLTMIFFLHVGDGYTDTVLLRNGDTLIGDIQNEYFVVRGSYSQIIIKKQFCKNLIMDTDQVSTGAVKTINNDRISGPILNGNIQIRLSDDTRETTFDTKELKSIFFEVTGPSRQVSTTIFTMRDGDRFSGTLLNPLVKVQTEYMTAAYPGTELNRIDFASDAPDKVKLLLINGDVIQGKLLSDAIRIEPDSFAPLAADPSEFSSIQFNARKMLLKEFSGSSDPIKDADGDGVPDHADHCSNTPWGEPVDAAGCPAGSETAQTGTGAISQGGQSADQDGDGVPDNSDKCPRTPPSAKVNERGCWPAQSILFDFGSYQVNRLYYPVLDNVFAVLKTNPTLKIQVQGNTDNIGSETYNQTLSENRARAIKSYLVQKGIEPERISPVGYGSTRQAASNKTAAGRALNRRTEFLVLE